MMNCFSEKIVTYGQSSPTKENFQKKMHWKKKILESQLYIFYFVTVGVLRIFSGPAKGSNLKNSPAASDI